MKVKWDTHALIHTKRGTLPGCGHPYCPVANPKYLPLNGYALDCGCTRENLIEALITLWRELERFAENNAEFRAFAHQRGLVQCECGAWIDTDEDEHGCDADGLELCSACLQDLFESEKETTHVDDDKPEVG